ncbi:MAG: hypothetical protein KatS3mg129_0335 [Leptospiraceae bacterium]|nr:MAG: hypothetical protein KatS3mg129_0335 [Leptospiraceae bacterium]
MQFKTIEDLTKALKQYSVEQPLVVIIDGKDVSLFQFLSQYVEKQIFKNIPVEISILTGEQEDFSFFVNDLFNFSLFIPYRLYIIRQGQIVFKNLKSFVIQEMPPKTWLLIEYEGNFPNKILKLPDNQIFHLETKLLYENQIDSFIHQYAKKYKLIFSEEAITEMKMLFPPKESIIRTAIMNIAQTLTKKEQNQEYYVSYEDIRKVFYPSAGWDIFKIIEAIFNKDLQTFLIEIEKYNPPEDNYYTLLKNLLNKTDELRKYIIAKRLNFSQKEILQYIQADKKPPFIQKKIMQQLERIYRYYTLDKLQNIYRLLVEISFGFRQNIDEQYKKTIFTKRIIEVFFS